MLKWLMVVVVVVLVGGLISARPGRHLRLGMLPGDLSLRIGGRAFRFPFASTLLLSLLAWLLLRLL